MQDYVRGGTINMIKELVGLVDEKLSKAISDKETLLNDKQDKRLNFKRSETPPNQSPWKDEEGRGKIL